MNTNLSGLVKINKEKLHQSEMLSILNVKIGAVNIATPSQRYRQSKIPDLFSLKNSTVRKFFEYDHIQYRNLYLPPIDSKTNLPIEETQGDLLKKFKKGAMEIGGRALIGCLKKENINFKDIDFLCCVTSTGFTIPGLSSLFIKEFSLRTDCQRVDIVGMGCNAGVNGLNAVTSWCALNPGKNAILLCVEICSAIYSIDDTPRTAIVNSLFGDGAAACLVKNKTGTYESKKELFPRILGFESQLIPESSEELRFDWDDEKHRYSFFVGKDTPRATAAVADQPLLRLLDRFKLDQKNIKHWIIHGGGNAILLGMQNKFNLGDYELRHTRSVLRDYGNVSSGSFLFSYSRLIDENTVNKGEYGLMMTMGPGLTIEMALIVWE